MRDYLNWAAEGMFWLTGGAPLAGSPDSFGFGAIIWILLGCALIAVILMHSLR